MRSKSPGALKYGATAIFVALAISASAVTAEDTPVYPSGNKIEGVWDAQVTFRNCATGAALFTGQSLVAYARGGVVTNDNPRSGTVRPVPGPGRLESRFRTRLQIDIQGIPLQLRRQFCRKNNCRREHHARAGRHADHQRRRPIL